MLRNDNENNVFHTPKKLKFRGELNFLPNRIEEFDDDDDLGSSDVQILNRSHETDVKINNKKSEEKREKENETPSFRDFFRVELTRGYMLEHDEERYTARRKKIYSFMCIPRDLERFMVYGLMQCADSFLYIHTFLPVRCSMALWGLFTRPIAGCLGLRRRGQRLLTPAEICDVLKCAIWLAVTLLMLSVDTNRVYHIIKSQSIIKLYIFYNMIEVGDRLLSAFGQDTIDALFWTATETKSTKREHFGLITHIIFAFIYVVLHSFLIMFQATTLNVAVNSNNKGLLTIMISNNFVELKGSVFKKFDKNNLFQLSCSDVRERFHLSVLLFIVVIQTMKEFDWCLTQFSVMLPDCFAVLITEILIDWIKHAFITRFNELPECIYREYTTSLAYDMTQTRQKHAFSDHSDLVARRMGFIPFPLGVVLIKAIYSAISFNNLSSWLLFALALLFVFGLRISLTICALGKACKLMKEHQDEKINNTSTPNSINNTSTTVAIEKLNILNTPNCSILSKTPISQSTFNTIISQPSSFTKCSRLNISSSSSMDTNPKYLKRSITIESGNQSVLYSNGSIMSSICDLHKIENVDNQQTLNKTVSTSTISIATPVSNTKHEDLDIEMKNNLELGATALFSNSDVDLNDVCLNKHVLDTNSNVSTSFVEESLARSEPDLQQTNDLNLSVGTVVNTQLTNTTNNITTKRMHRRSESEPGMQNLTASNGIESTELQA